MNAATRRCPSCYKEKPEADFVSYKCRDCVRREEDLESSRKVSELLDIAAMTTLNSFIASPSISGYDSSSSYDSTPSDSGYSGGGGDFGGGGASGEF